MAYDPYSDEAINSTLTPELKALRAEYKAAYKALDKYFHPHIGYVGPLTPSGQPASEFHRAVKFRADTCEAYYNAREAAGFPRYECP